MKLPMPEALSIRDGALFIEDRKASDLAREFGTPLYVVSDAQLRANLAEFRDAFARHWPEGNTRILPALKANTAIAVRRILNSEGAGCDIFGPGELEAALRGGVDPALISVNGSLKDRAIIARAIEIGARIVLDSPAEMETCIQEARARGKTAHVMLRLKPNMSDLELVSDFYPERTIRELTQIIKYGIPTSEVLAMAPRLHAAPELDLIGYHVHMGRHSKAFEVWGALIGGCVALMKRLSDLMDGHAPKVVDFGGGFPAPDDDDYDVAVHEGPTPSVADYLRYICETFRTEMARNGLPVEGVTLEVEPGRALHANTALHLTTVRNTKTETETMNGWRWAETDTSEGFLGIHGLNLDAPPFPLIFGDKADVAHETVTDVVGISCNAEMLFHQVSAPQLEAGDVLAFCNTGAYLEPAANNFNALPRPGMALVCGDKAAMIRRHETVEDVFARDVIPDFVG